MPFPSPKGGTHFVRKLAVDSTSSAALASLARIRMQRNACRLASEADLPANFLIPRGLGKRNASRGGLPSLATRGNLVATRWVSSSQRQQSLTAKLYLKYIHSPLLFPLCSLRYLLVKFPSYPRSIIHEISGHGRCDHDHHARCGSPAALPFPAPSL